jgi:hypothetical protein
MKLDGCSILLSSSIINKKLTSEATEAALPFVFRPSLLPAPALEHADRAAILRIEHFQNECGLLATMATRSHRIEFEFRKNFIFKFVVHHVPAHSEPGY